MAVDGFPGKSFFAVKATTKINAPTKSPYIEHLTVHFGYVRS